EYRCAITQAELFTSQGGTPGYKLTLEVLEGEHAGRRAWHDVWLSEAALRMAKRDLGKLGITDLRQLERPLPAGVVIQAKIVLRRDDDGREYNRVRSFEVVSVEPTRSDPFAPTDPEPVDAGGNATVTAVPTTDLLTPPAPSPEGMSTTRTDSDGFDWFKG